MAKTIEELKESINNTINQNGSGQITGQGLNILLNEMADVLSTMGGNSGGNSGGSSEVYRICTPSDFDTGELTSEEQEHNAEIFEKIYQKVETGEYVNIYANITFNKGDISVSMQINPLQVIAINDMIMMTGYIIENAILLLVLTVLPNGSVQITPLKYEMLE